MSLFHKYNPNAILVAPALEIEVKSAPDGTVTGLASTFGGSPDRHGDIVQKGAFARTLSEHRAEGTLPAMLWSHKLDEPIGRWTDMQEDGKGLVVSGAINLKTSRGREAFEHVSAGDATGFSIGYLLPEGGRKYNNDGSFTIVDADLVEVSVVTVPANSRARIAGVKSLTSKSDLIDMLREGGLPKAAAARIAAGGWSALAGDNHHEKAIEFAAAIERATASIRTI
ncbi:MAG: HK97 family phage prohead protease [Pseudaminobacter sp.]|nr:HK97 family phage prohead protease [Pseudaminobacter sp.]